MTEEIKHFDIWLVNLNPQRGTEVGKIRPVLIVQTDLLNSINDSTLICPITTKKSESKITKIKLKPSNENGLETESWIIIDQIRSVDNRRLIRRLGSLDISSQKQVKRSLQIILELE